MWRESAVLLKPTLQRYVGVFCADFSCPYFYIFSVSLKSNIQGIEKCAELQAQGMDCQPSVEPVPSEGDDGEGALVPVASDGDGEIWESCEEIPLTRSSCTGEVGSPEYFGFNLSLNLLISKGLQ